MSKLSKFLVSAAAVATVTGGLSAVGIGAADAAVTTLRFGTGSSTTTDAKGASWAADTGFTGGYRVSDGSITDIAGTGDDALYRSEHWGMSAWSTAVPNGTYDVTLRMAETYFTAKNARVFSVTAQGKTVISDLDLFATAGKNVAVDRTFRVAVTGGRISLGFSATQNNAKVDAILVTPVTTATATATPSATSTAAPATPAATGSTTPVASTLVRTGTATGAITDSAGRSWTKDSGFTGGYQVSDVTTSDITGTTDDALYRSEHWGMSGWSAAVPSGTYDVTLKLAETYFGYRGARVFSVTAEGKPVLSNLDIFAAAGKNAALDKTFRVAVADGKLSLGFSATQNYAKVDAIQVKPVNDAAVTADPRPTNPTPIVSTPAPTTTAPAPSTTAPAPVPTTAAPAPVGQPASSGAWESGASGVGVASGAYGTWRGSAVKISSTWADNNTSAANFWQLDPGAEYGSWNKDIDVAVGAIDSGESWSQAASGSYDARWRASLQTLKAKWGSRAGTVYIRFAHEMNGNWYSWSVNSSNSSSFTAAWKRYRAIQQQVFPASKLVFSVNRESVDNGMDWRKTFPGAQYVDVLGVDYYNQYPYAGNAATFASSINDVDGYGAPKGLAQHLAFAKSVGLPLAVSEWSGNADNGDSPAFIQGMHDFFAANGGTGAGKLLYEVQFNVDIDGKRWLLTDGTRMPQSAAKYRELF